MYNLVATRLTKRYAHIPAVDDATLALRPGKIYGLLGPNGSGKSTLMKVLNGVHQADSGEILLDGESVSIRDTTDAQEKGIGLIFQEFAPPCALRSRICPRSRIFRAS